MSIVKIETNFRRKMFFNKSTVNPKSYSDKLEAKVINIYPEIKYQEFLGFGGAFTEASGYCYSMLSNEKKEKLLNDYFSEDGLCYSIGRLTIASSDFSLKSYSYSKKDDLSDFEINKDNEFVLPLIKDAQNKNPEIKFLSSPWSPPKFMKTNKMLLLGGKLNPKYNQIYANYISNYIKEYKNQGINIEYITVQNEPNAIQVWESCLYNPTEEIEFAVNYLYPTFKQNNINTKILIWDHNKEKLLTRAIFEMNSKDAIDIISGFAFHWYSGDHFENIKLVSEAFPGKLLIHTEGCTGFSNFREEDEVKNAEIYAHDILGDLNSGINYYIDWNLILDNKGGPNHKKNYCNSPIMLNKESNDYYKNLSYYYIKHFSSLIHPHARRIAFSRYTDKIEVTGFVNPDNSIIIVLLNRNHYNLEYNLCINDKLLHDNLDSHAIVSYIIK